MASCCGSCRSATRKRGFRSWSGWGARAPISGGSWPGRGGSRAPCGWGNSGGSPKAPPSRGRGWSERAPPRPPHPDLPPPERGPLTLDRLRALWPRIVDDARTKSPMLGALLQVTEVAAVDAGAVTIRLLDTNAVHAEGLERQREALSQLVTRYLTGPVRIKLEGAEGGGSRERSAPRPTRLTEEGARAERLKTLRAQDPSLNAAVDALDLELLE